MFIAREDLKADLARLAILCRESDSAAHKNETEHSGPPKNDASVTYRAWTKTLRPGFSEVAQKMSSQLTPEASAKMLKKFQDLIKTKGQSEPPSVSMDECEFMIMEHSVRFEGPCICGSQKMFKDCCGQKIVAAKHSGEQPAM